MFLKVLVHSLKGCPEGLSIYHFVTTSPLELVQSLIIMESLTLKGRAFLVRGSKNTYILTRTSLTTTAVIYTLALS